MAEGQQVHQHSPPVAATETAAPTTQGSPTPGLVAVQAISGAGDPAVTQVVAQLRAHPGEHDAIMTWLQQNRGNAFVQRVVDKTGQIERMLPAGVELQAARAAIVIPGQRKLAGSYLQGGSVRTQFPTEVGVEVTPTGIKVWVSPGLKLDADWPLQDCEITGAGLDFAEKAPYVNVNDVRGLGTGMISISDRIATRIRDMIRKAVAGTKLVTGTYDPVQDTELDQTLNNVLSGFVGLFGEHDPGGKHAGKDVKPSITPNDMTRISAGATFAVRDGATFAQGGTGLVVAAHGPISVSVSGNGSLKDAMGAHDTQGVATAADVQSVTISSDALQVILKGAPVAQLQAITLSRGGKVTIDQMMPLGKLANYEAAESGISLLAALVAMHSGDSSANQFYNNAQRPVVVDGVSRALIEQTFTDTIHKLIIQFRGAVPGLDLAKSLGIG